MRVVIAICCVLALGCLAACGSTSKQEKKPAPAQPSQGEPAGGMGFEGAGVNNNGGGFATGTGAKTDLPKKRRAQLKFLTAKTTGACTAADVRKGLRRSGGNLRYCYEKLLAKDPKAAGRLEVQLEVDAKGLVSKVKVAASALDGTSVPGCVLRVLKRARFALPTPGTCQATQPLVFERAP